MKEITKQIGVGETNCLTLKNRNTKIYIWYENSERWFINFKTSKDFNSVWLVPQDLENRLSRYLNNGYKII